MTPELGDPRMPALEAISAEIDARAQIAYHDNALDTWRRRHATAVSMIYELRAWKRCVHPPQHVVNVKQVTEQGDTAWCRHCGAYRAWTDRTWRLPACMEGA